MRAIALRHVAEGLDEGLLRAREVALLQLGHDGVFLVAQVAAGHDPVEVVLGQVRGDGEFRGDDDPGAHVDLAHHAEDGVHLAAHGVGGRLGVPDEDAGAHGRTIVARLMPGGIVKRTTAASTAARMRPKNSRIQRPGSIWPAKPAHRAPATSSSAATSRPVQARRPPEPTTQQHGDRQQHGEAGQKEHADEEKPTGRDRPRIARVDVRQMLGQGARPARDGPAPVMP